MVDKKGTASTGSKNGAAHKGDVDLKAETKKDLANNMKVPLSANDKRNGDLELGNMKDSAINMGEGDLQSNLGNCDAFIIATRMEGEENAKVVQLLSTLHDTKKPTKNPIIFQGYGEENMEVIGNILSRGKIIPIIIVQKIDEENAGALQVLSTHGSTNNQLITAKIQRDGEENMEYFPLSWDFGRIKNPIIIAKKDDEEKTMVLQPLLTMGSTNIPIIIVKRDGEKNSDVLHFLSTLGNINNPVVILKVKGGISIWGKLWGAIPVPATEEGRVQELKDGSRYGSACLFAATALLYAAKKQPSTDTLSQYGLGMAVAIASEAFFPIFADRCLPATRTVTKVAKIFKDLLTLTCLTIFITILAGL